MSERHPNIILLSIDALRADHLGCHGYDRDTTATLDRLAQANAQFTAAYSVSSHTREAIPGLLTGQYPDTSADDGYHLAAETIAAWLSETPYTTGAFHSNPFVSRGYGYGAAFDTFFDDLRLGSHKLLALAQRAFDRLRNRHYAPAAEINDRALSWLESIDRPFFLWNHYMDPHGPYDPPAEHARAYFGDSTSTKRAQQLYQRAVKDPDSITAAERSEMLDLYDGELEYVDTQIGAFLDALEARGLLADSIVLLTADHGDAFGDHGYYGHPRKLDDELLHVPMLVRGPEVPTVTVDGPVSTLDIVPTVLDAVGLGHDSLPGESLLEIANAPDRVADRRVYSQARGQKRKDETHLRRFAVHTRESRCWLEREIDSGTVTAGPDGGAELADALEAFSATRNETQHEQRPDDSTNEEVERRLEALGYK